MSKRFQAVSSRHSSRGRVSTGHPLKVYSGFLLLGRLGRTSRHSGARWARHSRRLVGLSNAIANARDTIATTHDPCQPIRGVRWPTPDAGRAANEVPSSEEPRRDLQAWHCMSEHPPSLFPDFIWVLARRYKSQYSYKVERSNPVE